jgi:hypothetical protein
MGFPFLNGSPMGDPCNALLIATLRDDVMLDVETKILENSFVAIVNDKH